ncbi:MAG: endonuclease III [Candidatus Bathyarchaeota archaeon]|nr:endonuclease III [Candidatus Bathyarchaeota archaeon]
MWPKEIDERRRRMGEIIQRLEKRFPSRHHHPIREAFPLLIATLLSQNTSDKNSSRAFQKLRSHYDVTPHVLAHLQPSDLKPHIEVAGLYEIRSRRIIALSKTVIERFGGDLDAILRRPTDEARQVLMGLKGVGPKTADILLAFRGNRPIMPVDTNIFRVSGRIGLVAGRHYERTRGALEEVIPEKKLGEMHFTLIQLGRDICKPRRPLCPLCPIASLCAYPDKTRE